MSLFQSKYLQKASRESSPTSNPVECLNSAYPGLSPAESHCIKLRWWLHVGLSGLISSVSINRNETAEARENFQGKASCLLREAFSLSELFETALHSEYGNVALSLGKCTQERTLMPSCALLLETTCNERQNNFRLLQKCDIYSPQKDEFCLLQFPFGKKKFCGTWALGHATLAWHDTAEMAHRWRKNRRKTLMHLLKGTCLSGDNNNRLMIQGHATEKLSLE